MPEVESFTFNEPFLGSVWMSVRQPPNVGGVVLTVSVEGAWDVELLLQAPTAAALVADIAEMGLRPKVVETVDSIPAIVAAVNGTFVVVVPAQRLSAVLDLVDAGLQLRTAIRSVLSDQG